MKKALMGPRLLSLVLLVMALAAGTGSAQIDPTIYYRLTAKHSGKCLAVSGGMNSVKNGDAVIQWDCIEAEDNQKWQITPVGNEGYYKIIAKHSGKALDVFGGAVSTGDGVVVEQWDYNGGNNQLWQFVPVGDGYYQIVAKHSGKALDINGGPTATGNGPRAQQWTFVGGDNQKWRLNPIGGGSTAGTARVTGTFTYADSESEDAGAPTFPRPIVGCLVQVWRAGGLAATTQTDNAGTFNVDVPHMPDGTDTTVLIYATNSGAQVLAGSGPFFVRNTQNSRGSTPLDFSTNFTGADQVRSFNAAQDIRLAFEYAQARRDPLEKEVIPKVDVTFMDHNLTGTRYNPPGSGLLLEPAHHLRDLVIMHEYAHFLEDKIGSFLVLPSYHDGCNCTQRCLTPADCANLPGIPNGTQLVNSPENAWMEAFADYFAMAVKRANPTARWNLTEGGTMAEWELNAPNSCLIVGRPAFDGRTITGEMVENFVGSALWKLTTGRPDLETSVFQIFDRELDGSASITHMLPNIKRFHDAWVARGLDHARLDSILMEHIPTAASH